VPPSPLSRETRASLFPLLGILSPSSSPSSIARTMPCSRFGGARPPSRPPFSSSRPTLLTLTRGLSSHPGARDADSGMFPRLRGCLPWPATCRMGMASSGRRSPRAGSDGRPPTCHRRRPLPARRPCCRPSESLSGGSRLTQPSTAPLLPPERRAGRPRGLLRAGAIPGVQGPAVVTARVRRADGLAGTRMRACGMHKFATPCTLQAWLRPAPTRSPAGGAGDGGAAASRAEAAYKAVLQ
jgi:hypothetical protein